MRVTCVPFDASYRPAYPAVTRACRAVPSFRDSALTKTGDDISGITANIQRGKYAPYTVDGLENVASVLPGRAPQETATDFLLTTRNTEPSFIGTPIAPTDYYN